MARLGRCKTVMTKPSYGSRLWRLRSKSDTISIRIRGKWISDIRSKRWSDSVCSSSKHFLVGLPCPQISLLNSVLVSIDYNSINNQWAAA
jgi:hypothetical protein